MLGTSICRIGATINDTPSTANAPIAKIVFAESPNIIASTPARAPTATPNSAMIAPIVEI